MASQETRINLRLQRAALLLTVGAGLAEAVVAVLFIPAVSEWGAFFGILVLCVLPVFLFFDSLLYYRRSTASVIILALGLVLYLCPALIFQIRDLSGPEFFRGTSIEVTCFLGGLWSIVIYCVAGLADREKTFKLPDQASRVARWKAFFALFRHIQARENTLNQK